MKLPILIVLSNLLLVSGLAQETVSSIPSQDEFFRTISEHCGKAYSGTVTVDNADSDSFANKNLIMHVRRCDETQLQIPFHVGSGLSLKHDHRHSDGTEDALTQYGGHTVDAGWAQVQSFPADQYSKELFVENAIPQSVGNTWQMYIYPERFTYRLIRQGREFRVDFDLTNPVEPPPAPWGYEDTEN